MLGAGCHHDHCDGKGWRELRALFEPNAYEHDKSQSGDTSIRATTSQLSKLAQPWPDPLSDRAFYGPIGEIVRGIQPYSEADPAALLAHALSGIGALVDRNVRAIAGDAEHPAK